eukprot:CAMPEP_0184351350 /NCGR_PEP_ID=MMETSP1089-20130417/43564_1 /TAXON_ID=38269 ORGANISM="Gloeochaete wittrockiana, Strain SAG46.84" /NCGR_SAMPLE_ID=MMETSP1089 /ASSEMBLY_ACC=CAM_ASM_000445 /LENGTH=2085 /DNA_ID=CAMNT_0026684675 /DNA_START=15 /DNA_END=6272 /DNA_ORIENTATION=+
MKSASSNELRVDLTTSATKSLLQKMPSARALFFLFVIALCPAVSFGDVPLVVSSKLSLASLDYVKFNLYNVPFFTMAKAVHPEDGKRYLIGGLDSTPASGAVSAPNIDEDPTKSKQKSSLVTYDPSQTMQIVIIDGSVTTNSAEVYLLTSEGDFVYPYTLPKRSQLSAKWKIGVNGFELFTKPDDPVTLIAADTRYISDASKFTMTVVEGNRVTLQSNVLVKTKVRDSYWMYDLYIDRSIPYWNGTACVNGTGSPRTLFAVNATCNKATWAECYLFGSPNKFAAYPVESLDFFTLIDIFQGDIGLEVSDEGTLTGKRAVFRQYYSPTTFEDALAFVNLYLDGSNFGTLWKSPSRVDLSKYHPSCGAASVAAALGLFKVVQSEGRFYDATFNQKKPYVRQQCCVNVTGYRPLITLDNEKDPFIDSSYQFLVSTVDFQPKNYRAQLVVDQFPDVPPVYTPFIVGEQNYTNYGSTPITYDFTATQDVQTFTTTNIGGSVSLGVTLTFSGGIPFIFKATVSGTIDGSIEFSTQETKTETNSITVDARVDVNPHSKVTVRGIVLLGTYTYVVTPVLTRTVTFEEGSPITSLADSNIQDFGATNRAVTLSFAYPQEGVITVSRAAGTEAVADFKGLVDIAPPILACKPNNGNPITLKLFVDQQCQVPLPDLRSNAVIKAALLGDNRDNNSVPTLEQYYEPYSTLYPKTWNITLSSTDLTEQTTSCVVPVEVLDSHSPTINCPPMMTLIAYANGKALMPDMNSVSGPSTIFEDLGGSFDDNCYGVVEFAYPISQTIPANTPLAVGRYQTTLTVTDIGGNRDFCEMRVYVEELRCPIPPQTVQVDESCSGSIPDVTSTAFLQGFLATIDHPMNLGFETYVEDTTLYINRNVTVLIRATDDIGRSVQCPVTIIAEDRLPPVISCPSEIIVHVDPLTRKGAVPLMAGPFEGSAYFEEMGGSADDNCKLVGRTAVLQSPVAGTLLDPGTSEVVLTAQDESGNTASCTVRMQVIPIDCPPTQTLTVGGDCTAEFPDFTSHSLLQNANTTYTYSYTDASLGFYDDMTPHFPGTYYLTMTGVDSTNRVVNCKIRVEVVDRIPPAVSCPGDLIIVHVNPVTGLGAIPDFTGPYGGSAFFQEMGGGAVDNCEDAASRSLQPRVIQSPAPSTQLLPGVYTVIITAIDVAGNSMSCPLQIEILPIECPPPQKLIADSDSCTVAFPDFTSTALLQSRQREYNFTMDHASLDYYDDGTEHFPGKYNLTLIGSDELKRTVTCQMQIFVEDTTPPVISCPKDVYAFADPVSRVAAMPQFSGVRAAWFEAHGGMAMDNCESRGQTRVEQSIVAGTPLHPGVYDLVLSAYDLYNNTHFCTFKFEVLPIDCPVGPQKMPVTEECHPGSFDFSDYAFLQRTFRFSNFSTADGVFSITEPTDYMGYPGTYIFTMAGADDFEQVVVCNITVNVVDELPPSISCPRAIVLLADPGPTGQARIPNFSGQLGNYDFERLGGSYSDNCMFIKPWDFNIAQSIPAGSSLPPGQYSLSLTGTDYYGNTETCFTKIWVNRVPCPTQPFVIEVMENCWAPLWDFTDESFLYGYAIASTVGKGYSQDPSLMVSIEQYPSPGTLFRPSSVIVTLSANDDFEKQTRCTMTVNFIDYLLPEVRCPLPTNLTVSATSGSGKVPDFIGTNRMGSTSFWQNNGRDNYNNRYLADASDNCGIDGNMTLTQSIPADTPLSVGTYPIVITATDPYGNFRNCILTVTFVDSTPPVVRCPPPVILGIDSFCNAAWPDYTGAKFFTAGGNASDNVTPRNNLTIVQSSTPGTFIGLGTRQLELRISDAAGNMATCTSIVTVKDLTPPDIQCPNPITLSANAKCLAPVPDLYSCNATAFASNGGCINEWCSNPVARSQNIARGTLVGPPGVNLTITATDFAKNAKTCTFPVFVVDTTPPNITNMYTNVTTLWPPNHNMVPIQVFYTVFDNCSPALNITCALSVQSNEPDKSYMNWDSPNDIEIRATNNKNLRPDSIVLSSQVVVLRSEWLGNSGVGKNNQNIPLPNWNPITNSFNTAPDPNNMSVNGKGRVYTITATCSDLAGNVNTASTEVLVAK